MEDIYARLLRDLTSQLSVLPDKPEETPENTLRALWFAAAGMPRSAVASAGKDKLPVLEPSSAGMKTLRDYLARRLAGEPLAHITGRQHFMGLEMLSGPQALIPRVETEQLSTCAMELLRHDIGACGAMVIDVCTGCGNLALALAHHEPEARVFGSDLSADAVELAQANARHLGMHPRVQFRRGDLLEPFDEAAFQGGVDLIVCNPPYISSGRVPTMPAETSQHEPAAAFDGGPLGISLLMRLLDEAPRFLRRGGYLAFEVGAGQGRAIVRHLQKQTEFGDVRAMEDANGVVRTLAACRQ